MPKCAHKICIRCGEEKPISEFTKRGLKRISVCRACISVDTKKRPRRAKAERPPLPIVTPVICPCGAPITQPTNGVWLCPDCAPPYNHNLSQDRAVLDTTLRSISNCWSCRYQLRCEDRVIQGQPILCEAYLQNERSILLINLVKSKTVFTQTSTSV